MKAEFDFDYIMILSEKRASAALKPWWDIVYGHGLFALLGLGKQCVTIGFVPL